MKIGIDVTPMMYGRGVSLYTSNLLCSLAQTFDGDEIVAFGSSFRSMGRLKTHIPTNVQTSLKRYPPSLLNFAFDRLSLPIETFTGPLDVFHAWDWYIPPTKKARIVATVHDLALFKYPEIAHSKIKYQHEKALNTLLTLEANVIAVSQTTKHDLIELFDYPEEKIHVVYEALPEESRYEPEKFEITQTLQKFSIQKPFFLCVGVNEPRKNFRSIVRAWKQYRDDYALVIAGAKGWEDLDADDGLITTGHVSSHELSCLYHSANLLLYPSLYEGFGLPILEAFFHRTPVVTSNVSSMPEVAGNAAVLVDPTSEINIIEGIHQALDMTAHLVELGTRQLSKFSWSTTAQQTYQVYTQAVR